MVFECDVSLSLCCFLFSVVFCKIMNKEVFVCEFDFIFVLTHDENLFADDCVTFAYCCCVAGCAALHCAGMYSER